MKNQKLQFIALTAVFHLLMPTNISFAQSNREISMQYDIAAYVWPSYHPDDRAKIFWPEGIGEWQRNMQIIILGKRL